MNSEGKNVHWKEEGGALPFASFAARSSALRFKRGATVGGLVLATAIVSLLLCPGMPLKTSAAGGLTFIEVRRSVLVGTGCPRRRAAALVMRGATAGGAVEATWMTSARLCPGIPAKVFLRDSGVAGNLFGFSSTIPARREAARDIRGTMSGLA